MIRLLTSPSYALLQQALKDALSTLPSSHDIEYVDASLIPIQVWLPQALGGSLFAEKKITVITNAYFFARANAKVSVSKDQDDTLLIRLLETTDPEGDLFFIYEGDIDERLSLTKLLKKHHQLVTLPIPKQEAWSSILQAWGKKLGLTMTPKALTMLVQRTYPDLDRAYQELTKLSAFPSPIDDTLIGSMIRQNVEDNVFELTNHLMQDQLAQALKTYRDLMSIQIEPTMLISLLAKHFQLFAKVRYLMASLDGFAISKQLLIHEYRVRLMMQASKRFSMKRINRILFSLDALDQDIKKGRQDKVEALSWWLLQYPKTIS